MRAVFDLRTYALQPGTQDDFHRLFVDEALPMLERHGIDVVSYGFSAIDTNRFFLLRAFPSLEARQEQLDAFYGSREFLDNYDERVTAMIDTYHVVVIDEPQTAQAFLSGLRTD